MKLILIPEDKYINVDGVGILDIQQNFSWVPLDVHAFHWYDTYGEVQYTDNRQNLIINELGIYEKIIETFNAEVKRLKDIEELAELSRDYLAELRTIRNYKLLECDWTQILDTPLLENEKELWREYRQSLRNLPENIEDPKPLVLDLNHPDWPKIN